MVSVSRDRSTGHIICNTHGQFDDAQLTSLLNAISLAPEEVPLIIDLANTGTMAANQLRVLAAALTSRAGAVSFRHAGPWHRPLLNAI
jgi:hypothetical protein